MCLIFSFFFCLALFLPSQHLDLVLQRVLFALQRLLVDDFDGEQRAGIVATVGQSHLGEGTAINGVDSIALIVNNVDIFCFILC